MVKVKKWRKTVARLDEYASLIFSGRGFISIPNDEMVVGMFDLVDRVEKIRCVNVKYLSFQTTLLVWGRY